ncbi:hypothetical protein AB1399_01820, partial [Hydrogenibacillus schlegelii]|uniref:hypothetical protein n=1 Tax=Hydrogenibacillus schlegelii TaxID=1484 RepID=UPI0034A08A32
MRSIAAPITVSVASENIRPNTGTVLETTYFAVRIALQHFFHRNEGHVFHRIVEIVKTDLGNRRGSSCGDRGRGVRRRLPAGRGAEAGRLRPLPRRSAPSGRRGHPKYGIVYPEPEEAEA